MRAGVNHVGIHRNETEIGLNLSTNPEKGRTGSAQEKSCIPFKQLVNQCHVYVFIALVITLIKEEYKQKNDIVDLFVNKKLHT